MPATPELPTWQIRPAAGGHFRWTAAGVGPVCRPQERPGTLAPGGENHAASRLPSMADLLLQAPPELLDGRGGDGGGVPMFRTGSGRAVSVSERSVQKARTVLEGGDTADRGAVPVVDGGGLNGSFPMFCTGSGKSVMVRQSSMRKAAAVIKGEAMEEVASVLDDGGGNGGFPMFCTGSGKSVMVKESSVRKAAALLEGETMEKGDEPVLEGSGCDGGFPMFRTGSGKSVMVRQSSIRKASSVLEGEATEKESLMSLKGGDDYDAPFFHTGSGKSVLLKQSSIRKALSVLQDGGSMETDHIHKNTVDVDRSFSNSIFQTGSGKTVNISPTGLLRATTLLGLEGTYRISSSQSFGHPMDQSDTNTITKWENSHDMASWNVDHGPAGSCNFDLINVRPVQNNSRTRSRDLYSLGNHSFKDALQNPLASEMCAADSVQPPLKFHTAGGKSISISTDALKRARNLLGDSEFEVPCTDVKADQPLSSIPKDDASWNKENLSFASQNSGRTKHGSILSHAGSSINPKLLHSLQVDGSRTIPECKPSVGPLVEISNNICAERAGIYLYTSEKKRLGKRSSVSSFKRPRSSRFTTPLNSSISGLATGSSMLSTSENCCCRTRVSTHYPFVFKRKSIKDFFGGPPSCHNVLGHLTNDVKHMKADNADQYRFLASGIDGAGPEAFRNMLLQVGASVSHATKEWVANHYKWIVWKLASFERCYPAQASGKYLTVSNVLEELKYRYEREFNYGHRSALKKILDGDASSASMMVLCISAIRTYSKPKIGQMDDTTDVYNNSKKFSSSNQIENNHAAKLELTDGWYSIDAILDVLLLKQLAARKMFVGQKLRIWGAGLCGWGGPVSPLETSKTVSLLMHINGTYRAHWADQLGFCKGLGAPLAFRCIKGAGGKVPRTLIGVTRIYPLLYKERFMDGGSIVRSDKMEKKALQFYNHRRSNIAEDIMSEQQDTSVNVTDNDEGAKIFKILESAAEPEVIMADMSSEQLISFSTYQAKKEAIRQSDMQKKIEKALEVAGLSSREVTTFMRVRVVELTCKGSCRQGRPREGLITIWNPTEKQKFDLVEGQIYLVAGLMPLNFGSDIIYLQARGSSTAWKSLPSTETEKFEPFFNPRKSVLLSNLGEVPLASEFDLAAVIVHVGEVYISGHQKKQWIFMTDGSACSSKLHFEEPDDCLLAVNFCSPMIDNDSSPILGQCLSGSTVGFCNLVKRARDQHNHLWVAEATDNSTYTVCYSIPCSSHLKEAADSAQKWAKESCLTIQMLRERALCIIGDDEK